MIADIFLLMSARPVRTRRLKYANYCTTKPQCFPKCINVTFTSIAILQKNKIQVGSSIGDSNESRINTFESSRKNS